MPYSHVTRTAYGEDAIAYARGNGPGHNGAEVRNQYVGAVNMLPDEIVPFERQMQQFWNKADPRHKIQVNRYIVSFHPDELNADNPEDCVKALEIGCRIARTNAPDNQSAVFVQTDGIGGKIHVHILTNDVNISDCKGIDSKAYAHFHFHPIVDDICKEYFTLKRAGLQPERVNPAVRGARIKNEQIKAANAQEMERAAAEGRVPDQTKIKSLQYIWQDDLRERIRAAAAKATDENSFAHLLRLNGVELVPRQNKDGTLSYLHPATKKQPAHYTYELTDTTGFTGKIPSNLKSKSFKLGANYQPEGVARLFQKQPRQQAQADIEKALDDAKRCVAPIVHQYIPDADRETEDRLFNRFVSWHKGKRDKAKKEGKQVPPIFIKDQQGNRLTMFERLREQFLEFMLLMMQDEAEKKRQQRTAMAAEVQRGVAGTKHGDRDITDT